MKKAKNKANGRYGLIFGALGFFGMLFLACELFVPFIAVYKGVFVGFLMVAALVGSGYGFQTAYCSIKKIHRSASSKGYEQIVRFYDFKTAFPVLLPACGFGFIASKLARNYLEWWGSQPGNYYDSDTMIPGLMFALAVVLVMFGSFIWFFPYDILLTGKGAMVGGALSLIFFVVCLIFGIPAQTGIFFILYAACVLYAVNQNSLTRTYRGTLTEFMTPRVRSFNALMASSLVLIFIVVFGLSFIVVRALKTLGFLALAVILNAREQSTKSEYELDDSDVAASINEMVYNSDNPATTPDFWYLVIFTVFIVIAGILIATRKNANIIAFLVKIKNLILELIDAIVRPVADNIGYFVGGETFINYQDEEKKCQASVISSEKNGAKTVRTWKDFVAEYKECRSGEEQYKLSYSEFIRIYRKKPILLKKSDTAREIEEKYIAGGYNVDGDIDEITSEFENIAYAEKTADQNTVKNTEKLLKIIRSNLD